MTSSKKQITRIAAYGIVVENQRILLCRLSDQLPRHAGCWTLPGGGLHFGEDPAFAMIREVSEETGLVVKSLGVVGIDSFLRESEDRDFQGIRILYRAKLISGTLTNEVDGSTDLCSWWSYEEAKKLPLVDLAEVGLDLAF
ncbi:MAG: NUDIX hydrolase [Ardenticatenaceae bacterium]